MLEECEQELKKTQERCSTAKDQVDLLVQTLRTVRAGVEHLADKLQHIPLVRATCQDTFVSCFGLRLVHFYLWDLPAD